MPNENGSAVDLSAFTQHPDVVGAMAALEKNFKQKGKIVSDIVDGDGNQYVHLVQEGGGVLGVALVGYTYVLEEMGIRFMRLAGTSAGAINTMMLTCIGDKASKKWDKILGYLSKKNLFDFVDGHPFAKKVIGLFITNAGVITQSVRWIKRAFITLAALLVLDVVSLGLQYHIWWFSIVARISFVLTGALLLICAYLVFYGGHLFGRFKKHGFGINPGKNFHQWMKDIMEENGVKTIKDLVQRAGELPETLRHRNNNSADSVAGIKGDVTLITSDIVSENKVEFPKMCDLYVDDVNGEACRLHPADFVRASMSIPVFFESHFIKEIDGKNTAVQKAWQTHFAMPQEKIPTFARFVDGGILSNFPISIFYNKDVEVPRLPTFGVRLDDVVPNKKSVQEISLGSYFSKVFNTVRFYYDKDFLLKNSVYEKGIGVIDVHEYNWLNFGLSKDEQVGLFVQGVLSAKNFLIGADGVSGFDWEKYKAERAAIHRQLQ